MAQHPLDQLIQRLSPPGLGLRSARRTALYLLKIGTGRRCLWQMSLIALLQGKNLRDCGNLDLSDLCTICVIIGVTADAFVWLKMCQICGQLMSWYLFRPLSYSGGTLSALTVGVRVSWASTD